MKEEPETQDQPPANQNIWLSRLQQIWRRIENVLFGIVMALILVYFVLQASWVQNWLIGIISRHLSTELQTTVTLQHVDISFFDNLILEGLFIADLHGDTLLYAKSLKAGLNSNVFSLFQNRLEFNEISLQKARFNIRRLKDDSESNLQFILDYLGSPEPDTTRKPKPFSVKVQKLRLNDVQFLLWDQFNGKKMWASVPYGLIRVNNLDLPSKIIDIQSVALEGAAFTIADYPSYAKAQPSHPEARPISKRAEIGDEAKDKSILRATIQWLSLKDSRFALDRFDKSPAKQTAAGVLDYDHLNVIQINLEAGNVYADENLSFRGKINHLSAKEQSGISIKNLAAKNVQVSDTLAALYGMRLETNGSILGDSLSMRYATYRDFNDFNNKIHLEGRFDTTSILRLGDIMFFSPEINENPFFKKNQDQIIEFAGHVDGRINRLNGRDLRIRLGANTLIKGNFDGDDMAKGSDQMRLLFDFDLVRSNIQTIRKVIPGFSAPAYFDRLGQINFKGTYQMLFGTNHIFNGDLITTIGFGKVDMKLDLNGGMEKARYSGYLNMNEFNLAKWTGNSEFGKSTFKIDIEDGTGLTVETIKADLTGVVDSFYFRGYNYQNVRLNGTFDRSIFVGKMDMKDPNIDFTFDGKVNLKDSVPEYDFSADLRRLDLGALHLVKEDWVLSGHIEKIKLVARDWSNLRGAVDLRNFKIIQDKVVEHRIDSLTFAAFQLPNGERHFILLSDIADGYLKGRFEIDKLATNALHLFHRHFPELVQQAYGSPIYDTLQLNDNYKINLQIKDTRSLTHLIDPNLDSLRDLTLQINVNAPDGISDFSFQLPEMGYNGIKLQKVDFKWKNEQGKGDYTLNIPKALLANGQQLVKLKLTGAADKNQLGFSLTTEDTASIIERIDLNGILSTIDSTWQVHFNTSEITLFGENWYMDENNYLRFSNEYFETRNFELMNGNQRIVVEGMNEGAGARFSLANFDLNFLERFFKMDNLSYRAKIYNLDFEIQDLFALKDIQGYITTDTVFLNEKPYGYLIGNMEMVDFNSPLWWKVFLNDKDRHQLRVLGAMVQKGQEAKEVQELGLIRPGEFQTLVTANNFPLEVLELFIPDISKTDGTIHTNVRVGGAFDRIGMAGTAEVDGRFQLDYLKAMFYIPNQTITLSDYQIWADGDTILDGSKKNRAIIRGGLRHDHFMDWRLDCDIKTIGSDFLVMNTLKNDNSLYYGQGTGRFEAKFTGSFNKTNIYIDAETGKDTRLFIPLTSGSSDISDASFITFIDKNSPVKSGDSNSKRFAVGDLKGLNLEMNLSVTNDAEVQLIFDEQAGDLIKGRGEGNIRLTINREGEFKMYGSYKIQKGEYLFTLLNWVNKPFTVADGGTINWYGDPYGAQLSLDATYIENTSLFNLLRDELAVTSNLSAEASKSTKVIVTMHLKGDLFKPNISFDLSFPNVSSQLKSLIDSKLSLLRQDQNELTRQVFGLIVIGAFLPPSGGGSNIQSSDYIASAFNTLTQVLSNQFSNYLTGLAAEFFGGAVSSIDFNIAYNEYRNQTDPGQGDLAQIGRELQLRLTSGFVNDRITVQLGTQFGLGQPGTSTVDGFLGEDVTVEIQLTENGQWRLKMYQRIEPDVAGGSRRERYGFGINFRKEYETFGDMMQGLTSVFRKKKTK